MFWWLFSLYNTHPANFLFFIWGIDTNLKVSKLQSGWVIILSDRYARSAFCRFFTSTDIYAFSSGTVLNIEQGIELVVVRRRRGIFPFCVVYVIKKHHWTHLVESCRFWFSVHGRQPLSHVMKVVLCAQKGSCITTHRHLQVGRLTHTSI